jgi:hypothetical protein
MTNKLIVEILNNGSVIKTKEYKSLKELNRDYPQLEYHQLRELYLYCTGKLQRKLHPYNKQLLNQINIRDNRTTLDFNLFDSLKLPEVVLS